MIDSQISEMESEIIEGFLGVALDRLWPGICESSPIVNGVKIDVQGMEYGVLEGMREILTNQRPRVVLEAHKGIDRRAIVALLEGVGYDPTPVPIEKDFTDFFDESSTYSYVFNPR
jgi:hypothetical protein